MLKRTGDGMFEIGATLTWSGVSGAPIAASCNGRRPCGRGCTIDCRAVSTIYPTAVRGVASTWVAGERDGLSAWDAGEVRGLASWRTEEYVAS